MTASEIHVATDDDWIAISGDPLSVDEVWKWVGVLTDVATTARARWPVIGRLALIHRVGRLEVGEVAVVVAVSTPHRAEAFAVAQFCIDTLKHTVPIWKLETWEGGSDWSVCSPEEAEPHAHGSPLVAAPSTTGNPE
jgi:molybdopterin synthase catalytic subunit